MVTRKNVALAVTLLFAGVIAVLLGTRLQSPVAMAATFSGAVGVTLGLVIGLVLAPRRAVQQATPPPQEDEHEGMVPVLLTEEEVELLFYLLERGSEAPTPSPSPPTAEAKPTPSQKPSPPKPTRRGREFTAVGGASIREADIQGENDDEST